MKTQPKSLRSVLLHIVNELQNLQANQVLLANHIGDGTRLMDEVEAKTKALREIDSRYTEIRDQIAGLSL
jgi:hypothetical protein